MLTAKQGTYRGETYNREFHAIIREKVGKDAVLHDPVIEDKICDVRKRRF